MNNQTILIVNAGDNGFNRAVLQVRGVHILRHLHKTEKNSFDHITARMAAERGVAVDLDVRPIAMAREGPDRKQSSDTGIFYGSGGDSGFRLQCRVTQGIRELKSVGNDQPAFNGRHGRNRSDGGIKNTRNYLSPKGPVSVVR